MLIASKSNAQTIRVTNGTFKKHSNTVPISGSYTFYYQPDSGFVLDSIYVADSTINNGNLISVDTIGKKDSIRLNNISKKTYLWVKYKQEVTGNVINLSKTFKRGNLPDSIYRTIQPPPAKLPLSVVKLLNDMVFIQGGDTFTMGCTPKQQMTNGDTYNCVDRVINAFGNEAPTTQQVVLSDYYINKYEVTQQLWLDIMGYNPSSINGGRILGINLQRPVEYVSWIDCQTFINKLNVLTGRKFRLPTEAEWEYAARGGKKTIDSFFYSGSDSLLEVAWIYENGYGFSYSVGTKKPNSLGLYDMSGNVSEWCLDYIYRYQRGVLTDPIGAHIPFTPEGVRVYRGGNYWSPNFGYQNRLANRITGLEGNPNPRIGLRLVLVP